MKRRWKLLITAVSSLSLAVGILAVSIKLMSGPARAKLDASAVGVFVERHTIASTSGSALAAWLAPGKPGRGAVLVMHGVRANRQELVGRIKFLNEAGYSVLAFDFTAHGESSGDIITFGKLESDDARAVLRWMRLRFPAEKVAAIGISLGGAAALLGSDALAVDALILEAVYPDIRRAIHDRIEIRLGRLSSLMTPVFLFVGQMVTGLDPDALRPIDGLKRVKAPVFIMAGTADLNTRIDETREMFAAAREPKQLWEIDSAGHVDLHWFAPQQYEKRVLDFLQTHLQSGEAEIPAQKLQ